jgi:hypothetical protein
MKCTFVVHCIDHIFSQSSQYEGIVSLFVALCQTFTNSSQLYLPLNLVLWILRFIIFTRGRMKMYKAVDVELIRNIIACHFSLTIIEHVCFCIVMCWMHREQTLQSTASVQFHLGTDDFVVFFKHTLDWQGKLLVYCRIVTRIQNCTCYFDINLRNAGFGFKLSLVIIDGKVHFVFSILIT